ncbi:MAG: hypothetical protein HDT21_01635, partial [Ruminococcus sp.]|nr:hypothetical protein [Ruminococcus sp.]
ACGRGEGSFALCGARPKAPPLDFASWAQLDQLMSAASPPKICYMVRKIKIYRSTAILTFPSCNAILFTVDYQDPKRSALP